MSLAASGGRTEMALCPVGVGMEVRDEDGDRDAVDTSRGGI